MIADDFQNKDNFDVKKNNRRIILLTIFVNNRNFFQFKI